MADEQIPQKQEIVTRADAKRRGLKRYFTGEPCRHGHLDERRTSTRVCCECGRQAFRAWRAANPVKARETYEKWRANHPEKAKASHKSWLARNPEKRKEYGRTSYHLDIEASRRKARERRDADPQKFSEYSRRDYEKHKVKRIAAVKRRYESDPARFNQEAKVWNKKNPEVRKAIARKWARNNRDKIKAWQADNEDKIRIYRTVTKSKRRLRIAQSSRHFTKNDIDHIFKMQRGLCAYCRLSIETGYHIDHIMPIAKGGNNSRSNIQLCCAQCNHEKNAMDPIIYARLIGLLI